jgi:hypothetical protein
VGKNQVKRVVGKRQALAVGDVEPALEPLLLEIGAGQSMAAATDRRR